MLKQEEDFWKLKSRVNWLNDGDSNTRFFHLTTLNREKQNKFGVWTYDLPSLLTITLKFFDKLFRSSHEIAPYTGNAILVKNNFIIPKSMGDTPTIEEIKQAVFSFQPFKAPGPDGLHPFFHQKYWDIVGKSFITLCE